MNINYRIDVVPTAWGWRVVLSDGQETRWSVATEEKHLSWALSKCAGIILKAQLKEKEPE